MSIFVDQYRIRGICIGYGTTPWKPLESSMLQCTIKCFAYQVLPPSIVFWFKNDQWWSLQIYADLYQSMSIKPNWYQCQSLPVYADHCGSMPIYADLCRSMQINAVQCQSSSLWSSNDRHRSAQIFIEWNWSNTDRNWSAMIFIEPHWDQFLNSDFYRSALICMGDRSIMSC